MTLLHTFSDAAAQKALSYPVLKPGMTIKVHQKITEETEKGPRERTQIYEGLIIAKRGVQPAQCTITVRKISNGIGVERIFPLASPTIEKIEVVRQAKVRRAKLYYLRHLSGKATKLKEFISEEAVKELEANRREQHEIRAAKEQHAKESALAEREPHAPTAAVPAEEQK